MRKLSIDKRFLSQILNFIVMSRIISLCFIFCGFFIVIATIKIAIVNNLDALFAVLSATDQGDVYGILFLSFAGCLFGFSIATFLFIIGYKIYGDE